MRKIIYYLSIVILVATLLSSNILAAGSNISGNVKDAKTGEPLLGANIVLLGTSMGASTDQNGKYVIPNVPEGSYTIRVSYIGYTEFKNEITTAEGKTLKQDFNLMPVSIVGQEIVVTAQAYGQTQAINEQLSSNQIINTISAAKIQELPDNTVAESVGRLPGISVLRSGGEGDEVVIRGLAPKYNKIMIDGVDMSTSNPFDRSQDLSMISSNMLEGISVSKTVTADMDAEVIGGTINFELREAKMRESSAPLVNFLLQGSYTGLSDAYNKTNNYKYVISAENRYFDNLFGVFAQVDIERKNLTSNVYGANFTHHSSSPTDVDLVSFSLNDIPSDRLRYNGALVLDYIIPDGKLKLTNFVSTGTTDVLSRGETYNITAGANQNEHSYDFNYSSSKLSQISNTFEYEQDIPVFHVSAKLSHTYSETQDPNDWAVDFLQTSDGLNNLVGVSNLNPINIPKEAKDDLSRTLLNTITTSSSFARQRAFSASLDLNTNVNFTDLINANIKFGGKYRYQTRSYDYETYDGQGLSLGSAKDVDDLISEHFGFPSTLGTGLPISYFSDPSFSYGKFLNGDYSMHTPLSYGMLSQAVGLLKNFASNSGGTVSFGRDVYLSSASDYSGYENQSAAYVMTIVNVGPDITFIPGIRYQNLQTNYTAPHDKQPALSFQGDSRYDTTITENHGYWLPDVSLRYKPTSWCDIRLSYSNTIAYPDYQAIFPRLNVGLNGQINYNNYDMIPSRSHNYDGYLSFYENSIGLFTIGGFLKQIDNLVYPWSFFVSGTDILKYYPSRFINGPLPTTEQINTFVNDPYRVNDYGMELDWQTHFWYLPGPLSGLILNVNYTHIFSKADYPYQKLVSSGSRGSLPVYGDTSFTDKLLYQPNDIINLSLGFDYAGFSARVSMLTQTQIFTGPNFWPQLRASTSTYTRWDMAVKQELPWFGIQVYCNVNNLNGAHDESVLPIQNIPQNRADYGMTADLGARIKF
jgi:TonB-dependent receptor